MYSFLAAIAASSSLLVPHNASALASAAHAAKSSASAFAALSAVKFTSATFTYMLLHLIILLQVH